jgi:surface protein
MQNVIQNTGQDAVRRQVTKRVIGPDGPATGKAGLAGSFGGFTTAVLSAPRAVVAAQEEVAPPPPLVTDTDGDGFDDTVDAFPNDPTEWLDTDGDGVGDNADAFPLDPSRNEPEILMVSLWDVAELESALGDVEQSTIEDFASRFLTYTSTSVWSDVSNDVYWVGASVTRAFEDNDATLVITLRVNDTSYNPITETDQIRGWRYDNTVTAAFRGIRSWGNYFPWGPRAWFGFEPAVTGVVVWPEGTTARNIGYNTNMEFAFASISSSSKGLDDYSGNLIDLIQGVDMSGVQSMANIFSGSAISADLSGWNTSACTSLRGAFTQSTFNGNISNWDVRNVENMGYLAFLNRDFNCDMSGWETDSLTTMDFMLQNASAYNQPLNDWNVSNVTNMRGVFYGASAFNQPLNDWDVTSVTTMQDMFRSASAFNSSINGWSLASNPNLGGIFISASSFNQPLDGWDVSAVTNLGGLFQDATAFNQDISNWKLDSATSLAYMFYNASSFNQDISPWDVSGVTSMAYMFQRATAFDQDLSTWNVESLTTAVRMFDQTVAYSYDLSEWLDHLQDGVFSDARYMFADSSFARTTPIADMKAAWETEFATWGSEPQTDFWFAVTGITDTDGDNIGDDIDAYPADPTRWNPVEADIEFVSEWDVAGLTAALGDVTQDTMEDFAARLLIQNGSTWSTLENDGYWGNPSVTREFDASNEVLTLTLTIEDSSYSHVGKNTNESRGWSVVRSGVYNNATLRDSFLGIRSWGGMPWSYSPWASFQPTADGIVVWPDVSNGRERDIDMYFNMLHGFSNGGNSKLFVDYSGSLNELVETADFSGVTSMANMFYNTSNFNADISSMNTANVTSMSGMFQGCLIFNRDIGGWDVSNVTLFNNMFNQARAFNQDISGWNVSNCQNFDSMFSYAYAFNQPLSPWNMSNATNLSNLFNQTRAFNQDISNWDVGNVTSMAGMFTAGVFNQPIGGWNISKVTNMGNMFTSNRVFNQDISEWDVSGVTNMGNMFNQVTALTADLSSWNTKSLTNPSSMFANLPDGPAWDITRWDMSKAISANQMFFNSTNFNQDISSWDVGNMIDMQQMFRGCDEFNQDITGWNTSKVTNMAYMFDGAYAFNQDISGWDTSKVTRMDYMFRDATDFNQDLSVWDVSGVTQMQRMFNGASSFNADITGWDVHNVTDMERMFENANSFNRDISVWNVSSLVSCRYMFRYSSSFGVGNSIDLTPWLDHLQDGVFRRCDQMFYDSSFARFTPVRPMKQAWETEFATWATPVTFTNWFVTAGVTDTDGDQIGDDIDAYPADPTRWNIEPEPEMITVWDTATLSASIGTIDQTSVENYASRMLMNSASSTWASVTAEPQYFVNPSVSYTTEGANTVISISMDDISYNGSELDVRGWSIQNLVPAALREVRSWGEKSIWAPQAWKNFDSDSYPVNVVVWPSGTTSANIIHTQDQNAVFNGVACQTRFTGDIQDAMSGVDMSGVTSLHTAFTGCGTSAGHITPNLSGWKTENVTAMSSLAENSYFNGTGLNSWNTSAVTTLRLAFYNAYSFNQPLDNWDVRNVVDALRLFQNTSMNSSVNGVNWNWQSMGNRFVGTLDFAFADTAFNQPLSNWNVSTVESIRFMFEDNPAFNQDITGWDTGSTTLFTRMFYNATAFNQDLSGWNVSSGTDFSSMFRNATSFSQDLSPWANGANAIVSATPNFTSMFQGATTQINDAGYTAGMKVTFETNYPSGTFTSWWSP